jgi:regulator of protease activity HflC (stomatin/prohibitin superfamily)
MILGVVAGVMVVLVLLAVVSIKTAGEFERVLVFRLGRLLRVDLRHQTLADAVEAHRFVGPQVVAESDERVLLHGMPWPTRSEDGSPLVPGQELHVAAVEDDLRLVVGSA